MGLYEFEFEFEFEFECADNKHISVIERRVPGALQIALQLQITLQVEISLQLGLELQLSTSRRIFNPS
jgi:hypothetical protein